VGRLGAGVGALSDAPLSFGSATARHPPSRDLVTAPSASRTAVANAIGYAIAIAISFVQAPFLIHHLGDERYGIWTLIGLVSGYYGLLDLGTRGAMGFFIARARARNATVEIAELTATAFWFLAAAGAVVLVLGTGILFLFPNLFRVAAAVRGEVLLALGIALILTVLTLPLDIFAAIVNGCRRGEVITFTETAVRVLIFVLIFALFQHGARLDVLAGIQLVGKSIIWIIAFATARRLEPNWSLSFRHRRRERLGEIMRYGGQTTIINIAGVVIERLDAVVIAMVLGARMVTVYVIGQSLVTYLTQGVSSITLALTPFFADLHAKEDVERSRWLVFAGTRAASVVTGVLAGGLLAFGRPFIARWVGTTYVQGTWFMRSDTVLLVLLAAFIPRLIQSATHQYLFGANKQWYLSRAFLIEGIANLTLSLLLVRPLGLAGVAIGSALPSLISQGWFIPRFVARDIGVSYYRLFRDGQLRGLLMGIVVATCGLLVQRLVSPIGWPGFFTGVAATLVLAAPFLWLAGITAEDRALVRGALVRWRLVRRPA
jgi:O-antigen/teichoic acid export membrane protein